MVKRRRRSLDMGSIRIPLSSRKYRNLYTIIDEQDAEAVQRHTWVPLVRHGRSGTVYAKARIGQKTVLLHRFLMNPESGEYIDHIDGDGLNNQRRNLRVCSNSENLMNRGRNRNNTSGYKGVYWSKKDKSWVARLTVGGSVVWSGYYKDPIEAANAYDRKAREVCGEYAKTNADLGLIP